jgi:hypothetical protein
VASERQIAANRRNAQNSTGPRSAAGKRRASRNSYRHGLASATTSSAKWAKCVERLAREIAGDTSDVIILESARTAAGAEFDLAQIRRVKVAIIERIMAFGEANRPRPFQSLAQVQRFFSGLDRGELVLPNPVDAAPAMPEAEPERFAEAIRRALPELIKLDRYERRAAGRRERAVRLISDRKKQLCT